MVKKVRLVDIADRLGLTKVSVSKALRDHSDISEDTRALVKKTAESFVEALNLVRTRTENIDSPYVQARQKFLKY